MKLYNRPHIFRFGCLGLLLALATCVPFALAQSSPSYDTLIQQGKAELQTGSNDQALATGEQAIKLDPSRWEAYALAGGALMNLKHYSRAATDFNEAAKRAPQAKQSALLNLRRQALLEAAGITQPSAAAPATTSQPPPASAPVTQAEIVLWESIKNSTNPADFQTYLQQYPHGAFAALAHGHLAEVERERLKQRAIYADLPNSAWIGDCSQGMTCLVIFLDNGKLAWEGFDDKADGSKISQIKSEMKALSRDAFLKEYTPTLNNSGTYTVQGGAVVKSVMLSNVSAHCTMNFQGTLNQGVLVGKSAFTGDSTREGRRCRKWPANDWDLQRGLH
jgi:tetratricopeptide (TPR) repeat protein